MKIGFLLKRITYLKTMGSLIQASLARGHQVAVFYIPDATKGTKAYQNASGEKLEPLETLGVELVEIELQDISTLGHRFGVDVLVTQEGYHNLNAYLKDLGSLRESGTRLVSLSHYFEIAQQPISALDHFDKTFYLSKFARDLHFDIQVAREDRVAKKDQASDRYVIAGSPMFDSISGLDRQEARAELKLSVEQRVVLYISPVISPSTPWRFHGWREASRLTRTREVLKAGRLQLLEEIWFGKTARVLFEEIKNFCERHNAVLIVKSRGKQSEGAYLREESDRYFSGLDDEYFPVFTTHKLLAASDLCITANSMAAVEAVAVGVPCLNIYLPHHDRAGESTAQRIKYEESLLDGSLGSLMNYPGCVTKVNRRHLGKALNAQAITGRELDPEKRKEYLSKYLGVGDIPSSQRILEVLEKLDTDAGKSSVRHPKIHGGSLPRANGIEPRNLKINVDELNLEREKPDEKIFIVSFPKSGRTWLRVLISRYKQQLHGFDSFHLKLHTYFPGKTSPQFNFYHAGSGATMEELTSFRVRISTLLHQRSILNYPFDLTSCKGSKIIFLIRDPRDTLVSYYHQLFSRNQRYSGTLSEFLRNPVLGTERILAFLKFIFQEKPNFNHHFVYYENLHQNPHKELSKLLEFAEYSINPEFIEEAVKFASFENMRKMEREGQYGDKLSPVDFGNPNSFKVRKGQIGSFQEELSTRDIEYLQKRISQRLPPFFSRYNAPVSNG